LVTENKELGIYNIAYDALALSSAVYINQLKVSDYYSLRIWC